MSKIYRRDPLPTERRCLAARYLPLARKMAKPLKMMWPCAEDEFESAACLAVVEAAQSFDPGRNVGFGTFAMMRVQGALRDVQRDMIPRGWRDDPENAPFITSLEDGME